MAAGHFVFPYFCFSKEGRHNGVMSLTIQGQLARVDFLVRQISTLFPCTRVSVPFPHSTHTVTVCLFLHGLPGLIPSVKKHKSTPSSQLLSASQTRPLHFLPGEWTRGLEDAHIRRLLSDPSINVRQPWQARIHPEISPSLTLFIIELSPSFNSPTPLLLNAHQIFWVDVDKPTGFRPRSRLRP